VTLVYIIVYYFMVTEGRKSYLFFSSIKEGVGNYEDDITQAQLNPEKTTNSRQGPTGDTKSDVSVDEVSSARKHSLPFTPPVIWLGKSCSLKRRNMDETNTF
jgi:hypothetical protein